MLGGLELAAWNRTEKQAALLALAIVAVFFALSLLFPPRMYADPGAGLMTWRSFLDGAPFDRAFEPDPQDIAQDRIVAQPWWSPGQYLVPGLLNFAGMPMGVALSVTAAVATLLGLIGWIVLARAFGFESIFAIWLVLFFATFRSATLPFGIYNGGEVLVQAATPWLLVWARLVPECRFTAGVLLAAAVVSVGFFAKLSGLLVAAAALASGSLAFLAQHRRFTLGMAGGVFGALTAVVLLAVFWFAPREITHLNVGGGAIDAQHVLFAAVATGTAGLSWLEMVQWLADHPLRAWLEAPITSQVLLSVPVAVLIVVGVAASQLPVAFKVSALGFAAVFFALMVSLYALGAPLPLEERHFRPAGLFLAVGAVACAALAVNHRIVRLLTCSLCLWMSVYGVVSAVVRTAQARAEDVDRSSRVRLPDIDRAALERMREILSEDGGGALFVLHSPEVAVALPQGARILWSQLDFDPLPTVAARRYSGRVAGRLVVTMPNHIANTPKQDALLASFRDYASGDWVRQNFGRSSLFIQRPTR